MARRNPKTRDEPEAFTMVLSRIMGRTGKTDLGAIWSAWEKMNADHGVAARPGAFKNGVLVAVVDNAAICHELSFMKKDILERLNAALGSQVVTDIRFKVGR
mgnify:CR=1 FL=1